jgi:hypothetical protein
MARVYRGSPATAVRVSSTVTATGPAEAGRYRCEDSEQGFWGLGTTDGQRNSARRYLVLSKYKSVWELGWANTTVLRSWEKS